MEQVRVVLGAGTTTLLLVVPPLLLWQWPWPIGEEVSGDYLRISVMSANLPPELVQALLLVALWVLWAFFAVLVALDVLAVLRGHLPRIGLLRLAVTGVAGTSTLASAPAVAVVAPADNTLPADSQSADNAEQEAEQEQVAEEPAHVLERTRNVPGFGFDSADLGSTMAEDLAPTVELLNLFGDIDSPITVTGHADAVGAPEYNEQLSRERAEAVAVYLEEQLGEGWTVERSGAGSTQPREHPDLGAAGDRRAEITYTLTTQPRPVVEDAPEPEEDAGEQGEASEEEEGQEEVAVQPAAGASGFGGVLVGAMAGAVAGAAAGRLTAPGGRLRRSRRDEETGEAEEYLSFLAPERRSGGEGDAPADVAEEPGEPRPGGADRLDVIRDEDRTLVSPFGHVRLADTLSVSARTGLGIAGTHAEGACASVIGRALADSTITVITTRQVLARVGAPAGAQAQGLVVRPDTASAITEAELSYVTSARAEKEQNEGRDAWTILLIEAPEGALVGERLDVLTSEDEESDVLALVLGDGWWGTTVRCDAFDQVSIAGGEAEREVEFTGLRLLHIDEETLAAHFLSADGDEALLEAEFSELEELPQTVEDPNSEEDEFTGEGDSADEERGQPNAPDAARIQMRLFAPEPEITFDGEDVGARMRGPTRRMLALLALHRGGMGTEALTDALFAHTTDSKAKGLRNTASSDARKAVRTALGNDEAEILEVTQTRYQLLSDVIDVDVWRIEDLTKQARSVQEPGERLELLRAAAAEYQQELLSEVDLPWIEEKRQAYRRDAADLFVGIAKLMGDAEKALPWLERAQECDELSEAVCQEMMKAQAALERFDAVERTYRSMAARLKGMRAQPSAATNRVFRKIMDALGR